MPVQLMHHTQLFCGRCTAPTELGCYGDGIRLDSEVMG